MSKSTAAARPSKPVKPSKDFPLTAHRRTNRWCKKIRGKFHYFGRLDDPQGALEKWLDQKDDLLAGRKPRVKGDGLQVYDLCNRFLTDKTDLRDNGRLSPRTFADYKKTCERIIGSFGSTRVVSDLAADDFAALRSTLMRQFGPVREGNEIQRVRSVFKYAYEAGLIPSPVRFGPSFKRPSQVVLRRNRNAKGPKMFEAADLRTIVTKASLPMRAMVLLAINTGFGNTDLSSLPIDALDLSGGWVNFPRPKTGIMRRAKLWPETIAAVNEWLAERPRPRDAEHDGLLFITKYGQPFVKLNAKGHPADALGQEFTKVIKELGLHRPGLGFYSLRHVFETVAGGTRDQVAVNHVMGHVDASMAAHYREHIEDERLVAVADHVRAWLFPPKGKAK